jgi:hypothetical protein
VDHQVIVLDGDRRARLDRRRHLEAEVADDYGLVARRIWCGGGERRTAAGDQTGHRHTGEYRA